jgi:mRNA interferase RelE/StbE
MAYRVVLTTEAKLLLAMVQDRREQGLLIERLEQLAENPDQQGKALRGELAGYRSVRAVGQRYRVVFQVEDAAVIVVIVALGRRKEGDRKDVYQVAKKLVETFQMNEWLEEE